MPTLLQLRKLRTILDVERQQREDSQPYKEEEENERRETLKDIAFLDRLINLFTEAERLQEK